MKSNIPKSGEKIRTAPPGEQTLTPDQERAILRARAEMLAREPEKVEEGAEFVEVVEFLLAQERYGIESAYVREVYPLKELTPLPCLPPHVLGVMNLRGKIFSVIDIKRFFDLPEKGLSDKNKVIIMGGEAMEFGILADVILGVRLVPAGALQPSLPTLTDIRAEYLKGVTEDRLVVLDGGKLLADRGIVVHEEV